MGTYISAELFGNPQIYGIAGIPCVDFCCGAYNS